MKLATLFMILILSVPFASFAQETQASCEATFEERTAESKKKVEAKKKVLEEKTEETKKQ